MIDKGTGLNLNIEIDPIDGLRASEYDFDLTFYTHTNRCIILQKSDLTRVDDDNFIARLDTTSLGKGRLMATIKADIPDRNWPGGFRREVKDLPTGLTIV